MHGRIAANLIISRSSAVQDVAKMLYLKSPYMRSRSRGRGGLTNISCTCLFVCLFVCLFMSLADQQVLHTGPCCAASLSCEPYWLFVQRVLRRGRRQGTSLPKLICLTRLKKQGIACLQTRAADARFAFLRDSFHKADWCAEQSIRHVLPCGTHTLPIPELQVLHGYMDTRMHGYML